MLLVLNRVESIGQRISQVQQTVDCADPCVNREDDPRTCLAKSIRENNILKMLCYVCILFF